MKQMLAVLAVVSVLSLVAPVSSHETGRPGRAHPGGMMGRSMMGYGPAAERPLISFALRHKEQLGLAPDQVKSLESLRSQFQKEAIRRAADIRVAELELAELLRAGAVDLQEVEAKLKQIGTLQVDLRFVRIKTLEKGKAVLTAEQLKKLETISPMAFTDGHRGMMAGRGMKEMQEFMNSERMPQAMAAMMQIARRMGNGDPMAGMARMMEMMGQMGSMRRMMAPAGPEPHK